MSIAAKPAIEIANIPTAIAERTIDNEFIIGNVTFRLRPLTREDITITAATISKYAKDYRDIEARIMLCRLAIVDWDLHYADGDRELVPIDRKPIGYNKVSALTRECIDLLPVDAIMLIYKEINRVSMLGDEEVRRLDFTIPVD